MPVDPDDQEEYDRLRQKQNAKAAKKGKGKKKEKGDEQKGQDYELFLRDIEDDPEFRSNVALYKVSVFIFVSFVKFVFLG